MRKLVFGTIIAGFFTGPVCADPVEDLVRALDFPGLFAVLVREGVDYGAELEADLFPGSGGARWRAAVASIHDGARMEGFAAESLGAALKGHEPEIAPMLDFLTSEVGQRIVRLEIEAREAYLDDSVKQVAEASFEDMMAREDSRLALIERLVEANDLIEQNVTGAMNSNLAFYRGMLAGGGLDAAMPEADMMADLWAQEPQIREDTVTWLMPYLALAYSPLDTADLTAYAVFSESPAGQRLNIALFSAFDGVFDRLSREMGQAAAKFLQEQDI